MITHIEFDIDIEQVIYYTLLGLLLLSIGALGFAFYVMEKWDKVFSKRIMKVIRRRL